MWTFLKKDHLETFLSKYPNLADIFNDINLYESEDKFFLPRLFHKNYPDGLELFDTRSSAKFEPTFFRFNGKLREQQVEVINNLMNSYQKNNYISGIIKAPPGLG